LTVISSISITKAIADITSQLEEYRLKQLDKQETRKEKALTKEEREEAVQFLEQKIFAEQNQLTDR
jgi:hypothetical protein